MAEVAAVLFCVLTLGGVFAALGLQRRLAAIGNLIERCQLRGLDLLRIQEAQRRLADAQGLSEGAVEGGTRVVQAVHFGITAIPFTIFEAIPATRDTTRVVRKTHDLIASGIYGGISAVNKFAGKVLRGTGAKPDKPQK